MTAGDGLRLRLDGLRDLYRLHERDPRRYPFLLESVAGHPQAGRYDILFAFPQSHLAQRGARLEGLGAAGAHDFHAALSDWARAERAAPHDLPFCGGWFLLLGYEAAVLSEPRLRLPASPLPLPDALAVRCTGAIIADRQEGCVHLFAERERGQLEALHRDLQRLSAADDGGPDARDAAGPLALAVHEEPPQRFRDGVARIVDYLHAGDAFQVNLSRLWRATLRPGCDWRDVYRALRRSNPAPFAGLAVWDGAAVLSSSPERLVQVEGDAVQTRPIAGTRPRAADAAADRALQAQLLASTKERAEHVMLIDLERNDLGRVCVPGSVEVSELMTLESYAHVHHIVSNVRGRLRPGTGVGEVLRAVFPGGTITGCPKVRAMEIIAELEGEGRGPYTGAMGYLSRDGRLDTNILIRSLAWTPGEVRLRAGAGIVADSRADAELAETRAKARGLLLSLGAASV